MKQPLFINLIVSLAKMKTRAFFIIFTASLILCSFCPSTLRGEGTKEEEFKEYSEKFQSGIASWLKCKKQNILDSYLPYATASDAKLHEFLYIDSDYKPKEKPPFGGFVISFIIFWKSAEVTDGYLKLFAIYDNSLKSFSKIEVSTTNGRLNENSGKGIENILGEMMK